MTETVVEVSTDVGAADGTTVDLGEVVGEAVGGVVVSELPVVAVVRGISVVGLRIVSVVSAERTVVDTSTDAGSRFRTTRAATTTIRAIRMIAKIVGRTNLMSVPRGLGEATKLRCHVRAGPSHATPFDEGLLETAQSSDDDVAVRFPTSAFALIDPFRRGQMTSLAVATTTGGYLILDDARPALDTWNEVFGGGFHEMDVDRTPTPHALGTVAFEDEGHPLSPVELASFLAHRAISPDEHT